LTAGLFLFLSMPFIAVNQKYKIFQLLVSYRCHWLGKNLFNRGYRCKLEAVFSAMHSPLVVKVWPAGGGKAHG